MWAFDIGLHLFPHVWKAINVPRYLEILPLGYCTMFSNSSCDTLSSNRVDIAWNSNLWSSMYKIFPTHNWVYCVFSSVGLCNDLMEAWKEKKDYSKELKRKWLWEGAHCIKYAPWWVAFMPMERLEILKLNWNWTFYMAYIRLHYSVYSAWYSWCGNQPCFLLADVHIIQTGTLWDRKGRGH